MFKNCSSTLFYYLNLAQGRSSGAAMLLRRLRKGHVVATNSDLSLGQRFCDQTQGAVPWRHTDQDLMRLDQTVRKSHEGYLGAISRYQLKSEPEHPTKRIKSIGYLVAYWQM